MSQSTNAKFEPESKFSTPELKPLKEAKTCIECQASFSLFKYRYHCYNCGNVVCLKCSESDYLLKKFGYKEPVRCCKTCDRFIAIQSMSFDELFGLGHKILLEYIKAYNLPYEVPATNYCPIDIILAARSISNKSEEFYRTLGRCSIYRKNNKLLPPKEKNDLSLLENPMKDTRQSDTLCKICFDKESSCVFLGYGHLVTCMECAQEIINSNKKCPSCREYIMQSICILRA